MGWLGDVPQGAWKAYTPTWTASTNPAIGNGTLAGAYVQIGKTVHFRINLTIGSTTTMGSGTWEFGLPVNANATGYGGNAGLLLSGYGEDSGVVGYAITSGRISTAQTKLLIHNGTSGNPWNPTTPFTWATGDFLSMTGTYEAA